jgi:hypothetical protein
MKKQLDNSKQKRTVFLRLATCLSALLLTLLSAGLLILTFLPAQLQAQVALTPTTNTAPPAIVPMGDSLVYTFDLNGASAIPAAVTKVRVPNGYEILPSTPNQIAGTLTADRKSVTINTPVPISAITYKIYIKPLCNANVASNDPLMVVTYQVYSTAANAAAGTTTGLLTTKTETFANIYNPILNVTYPAGQNTSLNTAVQRTFAITQTATLSHINAFEITANVTDKTGFEITKIEVSKDNLTWYDITSSALDVSQAGKYVYRITRENTFRPLNYAGHQLRTNDMVYVRETVVLKKCDAGSVNYTVASGDGITFCTPIASAAGNVNLGVIVPGFGNDIVNASGTYVTWPRSPDIDGWWRVLIRNTATDPLAIMKDMYLTFGIGTQYLFKTAYIVNSSGAIIPGPGGATDTIFLQMTPGTGTRTIYFDNLSSAVPAANTIYNNIGMIDNDGDGKCNDFNIGKDIYIQFRFNFNPPTGCPTTYVPGISTTGWGYYNWCGSNVQFGRAYGGGGASWYHGGLQTYSIRDVALSPAVVQAGTPAILKYLKYEHSNTNFLDALHGADANSTSDYFTNISLPIGLDFDPTRPIVIMQMSGALYGISAQNPYGSSINMLSGLITIIDAQHIRVKVLPDLHGDGTYWEVPVISNSVMDNAGQFNLVNEFDYGRTGTFVCFGNMNPIVNYVKAAPCAEIEMVEFNVDRTTM